MAGEPERAFWESVAVEAWADLYLPAAGTGYGPGEDADADEEGDEADDGDGAVGGYEVVTLPVSAAQADYALNTVPACTLRLAAGRDVRTLLPSPAHRAVALRLLTPVKVWLRVTPRAASRKPTWGGWPEGVPFVLFEGYASAAAVDDSLGRHGLTLHCVGWPADLAFSSAVSRDSAPGNPAQFSFAAAYRLAAGAGAAAGVNPAFYTGSLPATVVTHAGVVNDLWGQAVAPWFHALCANNRFAAGPPAAAAAALNTGVNYEALRALVRFEGFPGTPYRYSAPLALDQANLDAAMAARAVLDALHATPAEAVATATLWDRLLDLAGQYGFAVSPLAERALVLPFTPGLRQFWREVRPAEYDAAASQAAMVRPLRAVSVVAHGRSWAGMLGHRQGQAGFLASIGGYYESPDPEMRRGLTHVRAAPPWAAGLFSPAFLSQRAAGVAAPAGRAAAPGAGQQVPAGQKPADPARQAAARTLCNNYARYLYLLERLRGRRASVRGRLRVDIAPGSHLMLHAGRDPFLVGAGAEQAPVAFGHVEQVSVVVDAEGGQAATLLALSHLRSEAENGRDDTSAGRHPLFASDVVGAPLCEGVP